VTLKSLAKAVIDMIAPGYANKRYLDWGTPREVELVLLPAFVGKGETAVDIGANRGLYVHHLLKLGAKVIAFEPLPPMQQWLARHYGDRIDLKPIALSDHSGTAAIRYPKGNYSWATIATSNQLELSNVEIETLHVQTHALDELRLGSVAFVKIDVEGYEEVVLRGGIETLRRAMPKLLIEIEERHHNGSVQRIRTLLEGLGYQAYYVQHGCLHPIAEFDEARDQCISELDPSGKSELYVNNFLFAPATEAEAFEKCCEGLLAKR
jgi:FkbM family methyltransferase